MIRLTKVVSSHENSRSPAMIHVLRECLVNSVISLRGCVNSICCPRPCERHIIVLQVIPVDRMGLYVICTCTETNIHARHINTVLVYGDIIQEDLTCRTSKRELKCEGLAIQRNILVRTKVQHRHANESETSSSRQWDSIAKWDWSIHATHDRTHSQ